jgi:hypothetical protein
MGESIGVGQSAGSRKWITDGSTRRAWRWGNHDDDGEVEEENLASISASSDVLDS